MHEGPRFDSAEQAVLVLWGFTRSLLRLVVWLGIAVAHMALLWLVAALLWWFQLSPAALSSAVLQAAQSATAAVLGIAGVSALTLLAGYWWLLRRLVRSLVAPLVDHLLRDAKPR